MPSSAIVTGSPFNPANLLYYLPFLFELTVGTLLFTRRFDRRHTRRLAASCAILLAVSCAHGLLRWLWHVRLVGSATALVGAPAIAAGGFAMRNVAFLLYATLLAALVRWAFATAWLESLIVVAMGYSVQHFGFAMIRAAQTLSGDERYIYDLSLLPVRAAVFAAVYAAAWLAIGRRFEIDGERIRNAPARVAFAIGVLTFVVLFNFIISELIADGSLARRGQAMCYLYDSICSLLAFAILVMASNIDQLAGDLATIRQIDALKERHYEMSRENIELVNTKFHDVRRNLASLRRTVRELQTTGAYAAGADAGSGAAPAGPGTCMRLPGCSDDAAADPAGGGAGLNTGDGRDADRAAPAPRLPGIPLQAIEQMENSIRVYDSIFNTGDDALDTLLTEKSLYCAAHGITLAAMADGSAIAFMERSDVYALFGNILDNAIEAVVLLPDPDDRQITFTLAARGQLLRIEEENYYAGEVRLRDGLPVTDKGDRRFHGFGMRSIARQVAKYGGEMTIGTDDQVFSLAIVMPIPA